MATQSGKAQPRPQGGHPLVPPWRQNQRLDGLRPTYATDEFSNVLKGLAAGKSGEDLILGYQSVPEFHADFRRMVRTSKLVKFDLSDIKEIFRVAAGSDHALLKQYESARPYTSEDVRRAWLKVLPKLVVGV